MPSKKLTVPAGAAFLLKGSIFVCTFYFLYTALLTENTQPETWLISFTQILHKGEGVYILAASLLIFLNWGLEARKWQLLAGKVEKITFWQGYRAVLVGICLGFITPNRIGDYAGRIMALQSRQRLEGLGAVFFGRFCQLAVTVAMGSAGIFYFLAKYYNLNATLMVSVGASFLFFNAAIGLLLFRPQILIAALSAIPVFNRYVRFVAIINVYATSEIKRVLHLSFLRYVVFVGQFMLLLKAFGVQVGWWEMALGVTGTFLFKSVVPSLNALSDLGMRELSAIYFFSMLGQNKLLVMSASISLWFINIALPSLVGLAFVWGIKWRTVKEKKIKIGRNK